MLILAVLMMSVTSPKPAPQCFGSVAGPRGVKPSDQQETVGVRSTNVAGTILAVLIDRRYFNHKVGQTPPVGEVFNNSPKGLIKVVLSPATFK